MVKVLASRAAGWRLVQVIGLLLIPIVYFGFELASETLHEMDLLRANKAGIRLMDDTFHTMLDLSDGWSVSDRQKLLLDEGPSLALAADVLPEFSALAESLNAKEPDKSNAIAKAASLMIALGEGVGKNDAGNREANTISSIATDYLPSLLQSFNEFSALAQDTMLDPDLAVEKFSRLSEYSAIIDYHARELSAGVLVARAMSIEPAAYSGLLTISSKLNFDASYMRVLLFAKGDDTPGNVRKVASATIEASHRWNKFLGGAWTDISNRLVSINDNRQSEMRSWVTRTVGLALATLILGLGTAVAMFQTTLKELDVVEEARREATLAREDAEAGALSLAALNTNLAEVNREVNEHLRALEEAQTQLLKKGRMEQMGQLTATIAHELRNPLGAARTSVFLLERRTKGKGLGIEPQIQRITNAILRCDNIITQLLDFSRTKKLTPMSADFDAWLERTVSEEAQRLPHVVAINCHLGTTGQLVAFDPSRMQRVVTNLLNNACEAMVGNGEHPSRFAVAAPQIEIRSAIVGGALEFSIEDNGPGITPENLARVREPLFTTKSFGTGLGLPAVEQIAAEHEGKMLISSEIGKGTKVSIVIPLDMQAAA